MASSDALLAVAAIGVAVIAAQGGIGAADASPVSTVLAQQAGQRLTMTGLSVASVPADEGFWMNTDHGRVWVQIDTPYESPYDVDPGDLVTVTGQVVRHDQTFPAQVGVTDAEGAADLRAAGAHLTVPVNQVSLAVT